MDRVIDIENSTVTFIDIDINGANLDLVNISGLSSSVTFDGCVLKGAGRNIIRNYQGGEVVFAKGEIAWADAGIYLHNCSGGSRVDSNYIHDMSLDLLYNTILVPYNGEVGFQGGNQCLFLEIRSGSRMT